MILEAALATSICLVTQPALGERNHIEKLQALDPADDDGLLRHVVSENSLKKHVEKSGTKRPASAVIQMVQASHIGFEPGGRTYRQCSVYISHKNAVDCSAIKRTIEPASECDLGSLAVLVSKWLSCGRMLFSPAHLQVERVTKSRILILDGLGDGT